MGEAFIAIVFLQLIIGATVGSLYFIVSNTQQHSWGMLITLAFISWMFGYALGIPLAQTTFAMFISLFGSAVAVTVLDTTVSNIEQDKEPPRILVWVIDLIKSIRGRG